MTEYAKYTNGELVMFERPLKFGRKFIYNPTYDDLISCGWKKYETEELDLQKTNTHIAEEVIEQTATIIKRTYNYVYSDTLTEKFVTNAIEQELNKKAKEWGYDNILSATSYANSGNARYDREGTAFTRWRSQCWNYCYEIIKQARIGQLNVITKQFIIDGLPEFSLG